MSEPLLEAVFKTSGVPTFTFVEPSEYTTLLVGLRTPGRGVVIEGPSGIGKTTAVETALRRLRISDAVTKLSARRPKDVEYIEALPSLGDVGLVLVDDFHKLPDRTRSALADYMKTLADSESTTTKIVVIGINKAGENLISFAHDLVNRIDIIPFESNSNDRVKQVVELGADALNVEIDVGEEIASAAQGSFYLAQMLAREVCQRAGVLERQESRKGVEVSFQSVSADVWDRLSQVFRAPCERFCRGTRIRKEGRAPYLHILRWLAEGKEWTLSLREVVRQHPGMRGSVGQVVDKGYLQELISGDTNISQLIHYDVSAEQITVEDPQFIFFIRNIPWKQFATDLGFLGVEFKSRYDFALSFAGEDRLIAEELFRHLQDAESEVFYDKNEQHRILAVDLEEYLRPIYQSEAQFVVVLLSRSYPKKVWTKFESDQFKERFKTGDVVPVWFSDAPAGMFDDSRRVGGLTFDVSLPVDQEVGRIVKVLLQMLGERRARIPEQALQTPGPEARGSS
jgi:hypothetical protein